jgi:TrbL/VirB6 plasmid conjugal transfer protein
VIAGPRAPLALALALLWVGATAATAHAQAQPQPTLPGLGPILGDPSKWVSGVFNDALVALGKKTTGEMSDALRGLFGDTNLINRTPPGLSYDSPVVVGLHEKLKAGANAGLAVVTMWSAINLIVHPHIRAPYHGALQLVPRVLVGALLVNTSLGWGHFAIDFNNALCQELGQAQLPGWNVVVDGAPAALMNIIAMAIYLIMGLLLLGQMLMRLALVDVLLVISPIALLCWVVPQTYGWARLWFNTFFGSVFVQFLQVAVLQLGSDLIGNLVRMVPSVIASPIEGGSEWLTSLLLGLAVLQLARKIPRLMPGYPMGSGAVPMLGVLATRSLASLFTQQRSNDNRSGRRR